MSDPVSAKNTKSEVLKAYKAVLNELKELKQGNQSHQETQVIEQKEIVLEAAFDHPPEKILTALTDLKLSLNQALSQISEQTLEQYEGLKTATEALDIQKRELERHYQIKTDFLRTHPSITRPFVIPSAEDNVGWISERQQA